jgi:poly(3-hydroxybutyrate) depolymerase
VCLLAGLVGACSSDADRRTAESPTARAVEQPDEDRRAPGRARDRPATGADRGREGPVFKRVPGVTTATAFGSLGAEGLSRWQRDVPRIEDVRIPSSADGNRQPALWLPPSGAGEPLLVVLHSWSNQYQQQVGIPFAQWAQRRGWGMIAPNFRGINDKPEATGSDLAVQDVVDAVDFAIEKATVDRKRVFVIGFSGGGMMSLLMAGRHPERFAGAVSWVPVYDLADWHRYNASQVPPRDYADHIAQSCGGDPNADETARRSCRHRSPSAHLGAAQAARVPVYIGHGLADTLVRPDHALRAFNRLADAGDRVPDRSLARVAGNRLPDHLRGSIGAKAYFGAQDPDVVFSRRSRSTTVVLFGGEHDLVYNPGLEWISGLAGRAREG